MRSVDVLHWYKNAQKTGIIYTVKQTISRSKKSGYVYVRFLRYTPNAPIYFCLPKFNVGLNQKPVGTMRPAWGADPKRVRKEKGKKNPLFQFLFPLLSCVTRPKLVRGPPVKPVYASFKPSDVSRNVLRHWNLSREEAVLSTVYFSARIEGLILWKNSLCNHRFSRYHFQRHYFYSQRNAL